MNNQFLPFNSINGDRVVGFTSSKEINGISWADRSRVSSLLLDGNNSHRKHLGMVELYASTHKRPMHVLRNMLKNFAVLEVSEGESITYDLPVYRKPSQAIVVEDTSAYSPAPGISETLFPIVLTREFSAGSVITYNATRGQQAIVSDEVPVEPVGDNFRHWCKIQTLDKNESWDPNKLKPGVEYFRITTKVGEYDPKFPNIDLSADAVGTLTNEFILGDPRALETFYTAKATNMHATGLGKVVDATREKAKMSLQAIGQNAENYFIGNVVKDAKGVRSIDPNNVRVGPALEYFVLAELALLEAQELSYAKAGVVNTSFGVKRTNEGLWYQHRRGKIITYPRKNGITVDHIREAATYVFKNSNVPMTERVIRFKAGYMAWLNIKNIFREEVQHQLSLLPMAGVFGTTTRVEGKLFEGDLDKLRMNTVSFESVTIPGIGRVELIYDETLDHDPMTDRISEGFSGSQGLADTSYSLLIEDASSSEYSNANVEKQVRGAKQVDLPQNMRKAKGTTYYIKPEGAHVVFGYEQGRMANEGQTSYVQSSMKTMGRSFWAYSNSAALELDVTKQVWIELEPRD
jgi:hypothetical protein